MNTRAHGQRDPDQPGPDVNRDSVSAQQSDGTAVPQTLSLKSLVRGDTLMAREGLDVDTVAKYRDAYAAGEALPSVDVFRDADGALWLADGWHRCAALDALNRSTVRANIHEGDIADAMLFAAGANTRHGLPETG